MEGLRDMKLVIELKSWLLTAEDFLEIAAELHKILTEIKDVYGDVFEVKFEGERIYEELKKKLESS